jgi:iron complex outermembrane receptor protein
VITRSAKDTQGGLVAAGAGNRDNDVAVRYGGKFGAHGSNRVYAKYFDRFSTRTEDVDRKDDAWHKSQAGFRTDWRHAAGDTLTLYGNAYDGSEGQPLPGNIVIAGLTFPLGTISVSGANRTAHWTRALEGGSKVALTSTGPSAPFRPRLPRRSRLSICSSTCAFTPASAHC